jgi:hypothetical protein
MYKESIELWVRDEKEALLKEWRNYGYDDNLLVNEIIPREEKRLDDFIAKIINTINTKNSSDVIELYPYFENLSNNRNIAFVFRELTGISTGTTNKEGIRAFVKYFGVDEANQIQRDRAEEKEREFQKQEEKKSQKKQQIEQEEECYYSNSMWDKKKISSLTPMQKGRLKKSLEKQYRYPEGVMSVKVFLSTLTIINKDITDKMCNWNRSKYNNMDAREQDEYEAKLKAGRLYSVNLENNQVYDIPKIVFDVLDFKIIGEFAPQGH